MSLEKRIHTIYKAELSFADVTIKAGIDRHTPQILFTQLEFTLGGKDARLHIDGVWYESDPVGNEATRQTSTGILTEFTVEEYHFTLRVFFPYNTSKVEPWSTYTFYGLPLHPVHEVFYPQRLHELQAAIAGLKREKRMRIQHLDPRVAYD